MSIPYPAPPTPARKRRAGLWIVLAFLVLLVVVAVIGATSRPGPMPAGAPVSPSYAPTSR